MKGRDKKKKGKASAGKGAAGKSKAPSKKKPTATPADPIAGTWKGTVKGPDPIPQDGLALVLSIEKGKDGTYSCVLDLVDQIAGAAATLEYDAGTGALSCTFTTQVGVLEVAAEVRGERMDGTWEIQGVMKGEFQLAREAPGTSLAGKPERTPSGASKPDGKSKGDKAPEPVEIDFEGITERIRRITIGNSNESGLLWSPDSKKLAFRATVKGASGLYTVEFPDKLTPKLLTTTSGSNPTWLKTGNQIAWVAGGKPATLSAGGKSKSYAFSVRQEVDLPGLHAAAFEQAWRIMGEHFYDPRMGNNDWNAIRTKYAPMAAQCATPTELELVTNLMLGELNASHLGFRARGSSWRRPGWRDVTGHLGARFDPTFAGPGLKVLDVVRNTPAYQDRHRMRAGEIVLSIDGQRVDRDSNLGRIMTGDPAREVEVVVRAADGEQRTLHIRPTSYALVRRHLYDRWVEETRAAVDEKSGGTLGYLHVRGMNWSSFLRFEAELYKVGHGKDGLIIDVRDNGGGFTTDHLLTCLMQPRHAMTRPRGGGIGYPHDRMVYAPWHKPIVVLCNQNSFSNAEIFAHAVKTLKRGPVVGVPTAGGVISTGGTSVLGLGSLRLPFRGWYLLDGEDMELNGCVPDHLLWPEPGEYAAGADRQLQKAVEVGLSEVADWKKRPRPKLRRASERSAR